MLRYVSCIGSVLYHQICAAQHSTATYYSLMRQRLLTVLGVKVCCRFQILLFLYVISSCRTVTAVKTSLVLATSWSLILRCLGTTVFAEGMSSLFFVGLLPEFLLNICLH